MPDFGKMTPEVFLGTIIVIFLAVPLATAGIIRLFGVLESAIKKMAGNDDGGE